MEAWDGLKWYFRLGGIRAVSAVARYRAFGLPRLLEIRPPGANFPVFLRVDTSDFCSYFDILVGRSKPYDLDGLDFTPKTIVDAGAHIGIASILFAQKYPSAKIVAIEPEEDNFALLLKNVAPYPNIVSIQAALWNEDGAVNLGKSNAHPKGAFQIREEGKRVRAITMDTLLRETGIQEIDILKVDIEGAEKEVFANCPWMDKVRVMSIELHERLRTGCRCSVEKAAVGFHSMERGEVTFFVRGAKPA